MNISTATVADKPSLLQVAESCGLFQPEELGELGGMIDAFLSGELEGHQWIALRAGDQIKAAAYYAPETFADGVWNLYFIGVLADQQGKGHGSAILNYVEQELIGQGQRILIIETSGLEGFELTRKFYDQHGYAVEARIRDYYQEGDDKVVFWKKLN
ncbi:GNAT family N-acetyltransferase [Neolewinella persica]|uniref:GNAT family N-acetyltransferase n=1 Tax=Neolewinella persica TaxID=70998 RepID=UPI000367B730|nr:GNAT family N-acetyltransferase [Neolewinella persica]